MARTRPPAERDRLHDCCPPTRRHDVGRDHRRGRPELRQVRCGHCARCRRLRRSARRARPGRMTDVRPYTLVAELTYRCPLRCGYCSNPTSWSGADIPTDLWLRTFTEAEALGVVQLHLT